MKYTKPKKLEFTTWQRILTDFPDEPIILSKLCQMNMFCSWVTLRGWLELMQEKGLITIEQKSNRKFCSLTETGKAYRKDLQWMTQSIPVAGENNEI